MGILYLLAGAGIFCGGFLIGKSERRPKEDKGTKYMELYGRTNGLMEPVKRGGKSG